MPLSKEQEAKVRAYAQANNLDEEKLVATAQKQSSDAGEMVQDKPSEAGGPPSSTEKPKLFMYHLPFVTVKEVRQNWLGLTDPFPGDSEIASEWAAKHGGGSAEAPASTDSPTAG